MFIQDAQNLLGLDALTGNVMWSRSIRVSPYPPPTALLAVNGRVYVSEVDSVLSVSASDGHTLWAFHPDSQAVVVPALADGVLYTGQRGVPVVYALDATTGALLWRVNLGAGYQYPAYVKGVAVAGDTVYAAVSRDLTANGGQSSGVLVALDRLTGAELWRFETAGASGGFIAEPLVSTRLIVLDNTLGQTVLAYDRFARSIAWEFPLTRSDATRVLLADNLVYVATSQGSVMAVDLTTGKLRWTQSIGSAALGGGFCGGRLAVNNDAIHIFDASSGAAIAVISPPTSLFFTSNIGTDGTRGYFTGEDGVYAIGCP